MSSVYKVTKIEGKGLGCVATMDIEKGSLILVENPQICAHNEEEEGSLKWIKSLLKSFKRMEKADQLEYMELHSKYNNFQDFENSPDAKDIEMFKKQVVEKCVRNWKLEISKIEQNPEKAEEIFKIICIYSTNTFPAGLKIKTSRFNHSCRENATSIIMLNGEHQVRAISNIKKGKEITITYNNDPRAPFSGFRKKAVRQMSLLMGWFFECSCDLCKDGVDIDDVEIQIKEAEELAKDRRSAAQAGLPLGPLYYSLENCKKEISLYKQLYKIGSQKVGKKQKVQPYSLFNLLNLAFDTASLGYQLHKDVDLKMEAVNFAKASEKFGKFLGNVVVTRGKPNYWKEIHQNYEYWIRNHQES